MNTAETIQDNLLRHKKLHTVLWIMQAFLCVAFALVGLMKLTLSIPELAHIMIWPGIVPEWMVRAIGACEVAGAIGIVVPAATRIMPGLTTVAAYCMMTLMIFAVAYHLMLFNGLMVLPDALLGIIAGYVAVSRNYDLPIKPRA